MPTIKNKYSFDFFYSVCAILEDYSLIRKYMKTIKCSQVGGGECDFEVTAETKEAAKEQFSAHAKEAHTDMVEAATPESMEKWNTDFDKVWEEAPEASEKEA